MSVPQDRRGPVGADKARADVADVNKRLEEQLAVGRADAARRLADAAHQAQQLIEEAKSRATRKARGSSPPPRSRPSSR
jgi:F-type H+-transporting ATPase subunit b